MTKEQIKQIALDAGFTLKIQEDGSLDLHQYVYDFAYALIAQADPKQKPAVLSVPHYNSRFF